jgi:hypothetical protein
MHQAMAPSQWNTSALRRRNSHEGVTQVPAISQGSTASEPGSSSPTHLATPNEGMTNGQGAQNADNHLGGWHSLYAVPEAGESRHNMRALDTSPETSQGYNAVVVNADAVYSFEGGTRSSD